MLLLLPLSIFSAKYRFLKWCPGKFSPGNDILLEAIKLALVIQWLLSLMLLRCGGGDGEMRSWSLGIEEAAKCLDPDDKDDDAGDLSGGPG